MKNMNNNVYLIALAIFIVIGCSSFKEQDIANEFKKANPDVVLLEQFVGEGDSDNAYIHFRYTRGKSVEKLEEVWLYQKQQDKTWKVIKKSDPKPAGSKFGD